MGARNYRRYRNWTISEYICEENNRNFVDAKLLLVPEVHWDWCSETVMVMERMIGTQISSRALFLTAVRNTSSLNTDR